jgi:hypothetical protein
MTWKSVKNALSVLHRVAGWAAGVAGWGARVAG